jgi:hypothetical protein
MADFDPTAHERNYVATYGKPLDRENVKPAWVYVYGCHRFTVGFPGINGDLFFSSPAKFRELWGRDLDQDGSEVLVKVDVPADFDDWDYVPENY